MGENTGISWVDSTFNMIWGCSRVSPACDMCYAADLADFRMAGVPVWGADAPRRVMSEHYWNDPLRWDRAAAKAGVRRRVFCSSMADVFEDHKGPMVDAKGNPMPDRSVEGERQRLWKLIEATPNLDWLLLTKRPQNIRRMVPPSWLGAPPPNLWLGTTVENQRYADLRVPQLLGSLDASPAVYFLSMEPLLGPVDLTGHLDRISWVILGGESGPKARGFPLEWTRDVMAQVAGRGPALFVKQLGTVWARANGYGSSHADDPAAWPEDLRVQEFPSVSRPPARLL